MTDEIKIEGLKETLLALSKIDEEVRSKIIPKANKAGAKILLTTAQANAPVRTGLMKSKIKIRNSNKKSVGLYRSSIGVDSKDFTGKAFYSSFVLWGHKVGSRKLGNERKQVPANDFLKRAIEQSGASAAGAVIDTIGTEINKLTK